MNVCRACGTPLPETAFVIQVVVTLTTLVVIAAAAYLVLWLWEAFSRALGWPRIDYVQALALTWLVRYFGRPR